MHKRRLHHVLTRLKGLRYMYFVIVLVPALVVFVFAYRQNNLTALQLRDELLMVDKQNGDVEAALKKLRTFTYSHMNAGLSAGPNGIYPPIQLKYTYERLIDAETQRVNTANSQLYTEAQAYCEGQVTSRVTINRVPCIQDYLTTHSSIVAQSIPDGLYKFDFVAPAWSPDLAGWSLVFAVIVLLAFVSRVVLELWLRYRLKE